VLAFCKQNKTLGFFSKLYRWFKEWDKTGCNYFKRERDRDTECYYSSLWKNS